MFILMFTVIIAAIYLVGSFVIFILGAIIAGIADMWAEILDKDSSEVGGYVLLTLIAIVFVIVAICIIVSRAYGL